MPDKPSPIVVPMSRDPRQAVEQDVRDGIFKRRVLDVVDPEIRHHPVVAALVREVRALQISLVMQERFRIALTGWLLTGQEMPIEDFEKELDNIDAENHRLAALHSVPCTPVVEDGNGNPALTVWGEPLLGLFVEEAEDACTVTLVAPPLTPYYGLHGTAFHGDGATAKADAIAQARECVEGAVDEAAGDE